MSEEPDLLYTICYDLLVTILGKDGYMLLPVEIEDGLKLGETGKIAITPFGEGRYIIQSQESFLKGAPERVATELGLSHNEYDLIMAEHKMDGAFENFSDRTMMSDAEHFRRRKTK